MKLMRTERYDPSKIVISVKGTVLPDSGNTFTGRELYRCLAENYHLQAEMAAGFYVVLMTSPADTREGIERLLTALFEIDRKLDLQKRNKKDFTDISESTAEEDMPFLEKNTVSYETVYEAAMNARK